MSNREQKSTLVRFGRYYIRNQGGRGTYREIRRTRCSLCSPIQDRRSRAGKSPAGVTLGSEEIGRRSGPRETEDPTIGRSDYLGVHTYPTPTPGGEKESISYKIVIRKPPSLVRTLSLKPPSISECRRKFSDDVGRSVCVSRSDR